MALRSSGGNFDPLPWLYTIHHLGGRSLDEIIEFIDRLILSWDWDVSAYTSGYIKSSYLEE